MAYFLVENFKAGLDVRKSILTSPAGTLTRLVNAAVTPGGEIQKRRAFVKVADVSGTFGLASMGTKLILFTKNVQTPNPGIKDPVTGASPADVTMEYHRVPNSSPTSYMTDFDIFDGKPYVVLYDPTPSDPIPVGTGPLPAGVPTGTTYKVTGENDLVIVWRGDAWADWEAKKRVAYMPARGYNGSTFRNLTNGNIYEVNYAGEWTDWKPKDKGAGVPTGADGATIISLSPSTSTSPTNAYNNLFGIDWSKITANLPSGVEISRPTWASGAQYGKTPVGAVAPDYMGNGDTFMDTSNGNVYVVKGKKWATWYPDGSGEFLPSSQMEGYTVYNYNEKKTYVTKNQTWQPWQPDHTVATRPTAYKDNDAWKNTADGLTYVWRTKDWVPFKPPEFSDKTNYAIGTFMTRNGSIYKARVAINAGQFDAAMWDLVGFANSVKAMNPHYYLDDRDKVKDQLTQNLDLSWEWTTKVNPNKGKYQETEGSGMGLYVRAYKSKMYCVGDKYLRFSAVDDAFKWEAATDPNDTSRTGAGYINVSLQEGASSQLQGVEIYYDKIALLSELTTQIWAVVSDPKQNALGQVLRQTGTKAPWSVQQYGSGDILFLASSGIRSLKARDLSNSAAVSDIGSPIDDYIRDIPVFDRTMCRSVLEPVVGRVWFTFRRSICVLSFFPGPGITAWSTYTTDFDIDYIVSCGDRLFLRSGNDLYLFGGVDGNTYDATPVEVRLPFLDGSKPGHQKMFQAIDATVTGTWDIKISYDFDNPDHEESVARVTAPTWNKGRYELQGYASHMSLRFYNSTAEKAIVSNAAIHYNIGADVD